MSEGQSVLHSWMETLANYIVGFVLGIAAQFLVYPYFGIQIDLMLNLKLALTFTVISIVRSYFMRRLFNRIAVASQNR